MFCSNKLKKKNSKKKKKQKNKNTETAKRFFVSHGEPCSRSTFTLQQVEGLLDKLAHLTKEDDQYQVLAYARALLSSSLSLCDVVWCGG
jgi:hypothetical protein